MDSLFQSETGADLAPQHARFSGAAHPVAFVTTDHEVKKHLVSRHSGLAVRWDVTEMENSLGRRLNLAAKRAMDIVGALVGLVLLGPLMIIVALAIKATSPGPVLFKQKREGINGRIFEAYKFRSMGAEIGDATGVSQTLSNDPRVTSVGRFIRKTSIDELPQLFNVLRGDMSLVGPRPHVPGMMAAGRLYKELVPYYDRRLQMLPGITGWAQVNGLRGSTRDPHKARERVDHDLAYIQNFSVWLDVKIIALTIVREFVTGNGD
ncbi:exopolysaccharide biosynthesis polyprenyl glycosylphosphotransferase [Devosia salina]|uniref:Exopolysaccharide biosynthesis polyprenyl glycosylphosphotransferase n=1 Tax=Devosia salina TaxID=2860336 RepID=A0ABX8WJ03_9HYPH|nr:exopolysaccharide biosynthesis polyprenyl glycosylphosphotransferase [Devosia salina]QYO78869.1 exopolysaccharide biosynthesis polyprenyl glycosylphosphotransferase [Devosia salina]